MGLGTASFAEGRAEVADGLQPAAPRQLAAVRAAVDPDRRIAASRVLAALGGV